ncbi:MAG: NUDIX hydrolase [Bacteroidota bacterium]
MKIFINDIPVNLMKTSSIRNMGAFIHVLDGTERIVPKMLLDDVLVLNASPENVDELLHLMTDKKLKNLDSVTFATEDKKHLLKYIKRKFSIVKAAGGVVEKDQKTLLIYRLGKWDLPKGKQDKGETIKQCAIREVEEETGVKVHLGERIGHTWHTYTRNKKYVLKKTSWFTMKCEDDRDMGPQLEENIDDVKWMDLTETREALFESYRTIRYVMTEYHKMLREKVSAYDTPS